MSAPTLITEASEASSASPQIAVAEQESTYDGAATKSDEQVSPRNGRTVASLGIGLSPVSALFSHKVEVIRGGAVRASSVFIVATNALTFACDVVRTVNESERTHFSITWWLSLAGTLVTLIDYSLKTIFGEKWCPSLRLANWLLVKLDWHSTPYVPASMLRLQGVVLISFLLTGVIMRYLDLYIVASIFSGMVAAQAMSYGFFNFCTFAIVFGYLVKHGIFFRFSNEAVQMLESNPTGKVVYSPIGPEVDASLHQVGARKDGKVAPDPSTEDRKIELVA